MQDHTHAFTRCDGPASYHVAYRCRHCGLVMRYEESDDGRTWWWEVIRDGTKVAIIRCMTRGRTLAETAEYAGLSCVGNPETIEPPPGTLLRWVKTTIRRWVSPVGTDD